MEALGYSVDEKGYMMRDGKRALTISGKEIKHKHVAGFHKDGLIGSDITSSIDMVEKNQRTMNKQDILEEIEELQETIYEKMLVLKEYVDAEKDIDTELEPAYDDLQIAVSNVNDELDSIASVIEST